MSIPVVEIEHKIEDIECVNCPHWNNQRRYCGATCPQVHAPDCPTCAVEANNKAWAKYLVEKHCPTRDDDYWKHRAVYMPVEDWEQIKKLAEEKVDG